MDLAGAGQPTPNYACPASWQWICVVRGSDQCRRGRNHLPTRRHDVHIVQASAPKKAKSSAPLEDLHTRALSLGSIGLEPR
jgi:hypothetical protein